MARYHTVGPGECLLSIAHEYGFGDHTAIYDHPRNADLKSKRPNPSVLLAGDEIFIPDPTPKHIECHTGARHSFRLTLPKAMLRLYVHYHDAPLRHRPWKLTVDGASKTGLTDGDGLVSVELPMRAREGKLLFEEDGFEYDLVIGGLDPLDEESGVRGRLGNLGHFVNDDGCDEAERLRRGIAHFQAANGLEPSGRLDEATKQKLRDVHDLGRAS